MIVHDKFLDPNGILKPIHDLQQQVDALSEKLDALDTAVKNLSESAS